MAIRSPHTVLFIGDSITHAHRRPEELHDCYRLGCGYVNLIASELSATRPHTYRLLNRGECGDTIAHLAHRWENDCLAAAPDVVSILIGINDAQDPQLSVDDFRDRYADLLARTRQQLPRANLIVMEPFGLAVDPDPALEVISPAQMQRLATLQPMVVQVAADSSAAFVPLQSIFNDAAKRIPANFWMRDGIHPSAAGHWLIARAWLQAMSARALNR